MKNKNQLLSQKPERYSFAINEYYIDTRYTSCPRCNHKTFRRKFPLAIHIKDAPLLILGLTCVYCANCEFIIAHKDDLETELFIAFEKIAPDKIGEEYFIIGTVDKNLWKRNLSSPEGGGSSADIIFFKEYMTLKLDPGGWRPA